MQLDPNEYVGPQLSVRNKIWQPIPQPELLGGGTVAGVADPRSEMAAAEQIESPAQCAQV